MKILIIALSLLTLSGCALTEFARDYLDDMVDTNMYDDSKVVDSMICDKDILENLKNNHTDAWYKEVSKGCEE